MQACSGGKHFHPPLVSYDYMYGDHDSRCMYIVTSCGHAVQSYGCMHGAGVIILVCWRLRRWKSQ